MIFELHLTANQMPELLQRSHEWRMVRCGDVTASQFFRVLTPAQTKRDREAGIMGRTAKGYLVELLAEMETGIPGDRKSFPETEWGNEHESHAFEAAQEALKKKLGIDSIELPHGQYAYIQHATEEMIGCSPDGVIGDDGLLELKCPFNPHNHQWAICEGLDWFMHKHEAQVQGSLWITGRHYYWLASFHPNFAQKCLAWVVERDEAYIEELATQVIAFRDTLLSEYNRLSQGIPF